MHRTLCSLTMLAVACLVASVADAGDFSVKDVDGPTAFAFDGFNDYATAGKPATVSDGDFTVDTWVLFHSLERPPRAVWRWLAGWSAKMWDRSSVGTW